MPKPPRLCDVEYRNSQRNPSKPGERAEDEGRKPARATSRLPRGLLRGPPIPNTGRTQLAISILFSLGDGLIRCVVRTAIAPRAIARGICHELLISGSRQASRATLPMARLFASS